MRFSLHLFLFITVVLISGCGGKGATPQTSTPVVEPEWHAPVSYAMSVQNVTHLPLPVGPWACWPVQVKTQVVAASFKMVRGDVPMTFTYSALYMPQTTMWIEPVIPAGYQFVQWDVVGTAGVVYTEGTRLTWTTPGRDYTESEGPAGNTVITLILMPVGNG
jgi:hypothetical protein